MSATERTAAFFRRNRKRWVSALLLLRVGGALAWRTEVSRCRTDLGMTIDHKSERKGGKVLSFYRYSGKQA